MMTDNGPPSATAKRLPILKGPKRQHFLPECYLNGFCGDGTIAVYDRIIDEARNQTPVNTAVVGHLYTMLDAQGRRRFEIEDMLAQFEGKSAPVLRKLAADLTTDERTDFAIFVALAACRTPDMIDSLKAINSLEIGRVANDLFSDVEAVKQRVRASMAESSEEQIDNEARELVQFAKSGAYKVETEHRWAVSMAMQIALAIAPGIAGRNWLIHHCDTERTSFITSDSPVVVTLPDASNKNLFDIGFDHKDAVIAFPLSTSCLLTLDGAAGALTHRDVPRDFVRSFNLYLARRCQRFLIARHRAQVEWLAKRCELAQTKWQPKMSPEGVQKLATDAS